MVVNLSTNKLKTVAGRLAGNAFVILADTNEHRRMLGILGWFGLGLVS